MTVVSLSNGILSVPSGNLVGCFMNKWLQWQHDRTARVRGTESGPESDVSVLGGLCTCIMSPGTPPSLRNVLLDDPPASLVLEVVEVLRNCVLG